MVRVAWWGPDERPSFKIRPIGGDGAIAVKPWPGSFEEFAERKAEAEAAEAPERQRQAYVASLQAERVGVAQRLAGVERLADDEPVRTPFVEGPEPPTAAKARRHLRARLAAIDAELARASE